MASLLVQITPPRLFNQPQPPLLTRGRGISRNVAASRSPRHPNNPQPLLINLVEATSWLEVTMKVERPVSVDQRNQRAPVASVVAEAPSLASNAAKPMTERQPPTQPCEYQPLSVPEKFDADLAFDRDELLSSGSHMGSRAPKVWQVKELKVKLSALEATVAVKGGIFTYDDLLM